jgi:hypothetical protein
MINKTTGSLELKLAGFNPANTPARGVAVPLFIKLDQKNKKNKIIN